MNDLVVSVRLNADGSGLVGQTRLSKQEMDKRTGAVRETSSAARELSGATRAAGDAQADAAAKTRVNTQAVNDNTRANQRNTVSAASNRAGWAQLGQQVQDVSIQAQMGTSAFTIFAQQSGQVAGAMSLMGGALGSVGRFLMGPWGIAFTIGTAILGPFISRLFDTGDAASATQKRIDGVRAAMVKLQEQAGKVDFSSDEFNNQQRERLTLQSEIAALEGTRPRDGSRSAQVEQNARNRRLQAARERLAELDADYAGVMKQVEARRKLDALDKAAADQKKQDRKDAVADRKSEREAEAAAKKAKAEEEAHNKALAASLDQIQAKYDPLTKAARDYRDTLKEIADLAAAGKIDSLQRAAYEAQAAQSTKDAQSAYITSGLSATLDFSSFDKDLQRAAEESSKRLGLGGKEAEKAMRRGADAIYRVVGGGALGSLAGALGSQFGVQLSQETPAQFLAKQIKGLTDSIGGSAFSDAIGAGMGKAFDGASTGKFVSGIADAVGVKMSGTGAQIGGAIGSALPIPGGQIIGSILGGLVGGLFSSTKKGTATITGGTDADVSTSGNSAKREQASLGLAGSVQDSLKAIADQFGGELGKFAVSIGIRDDNYRVDPTGRGMTKKKNGAIDFGDNESAAIAYAIRDAIADGAVTGLSAAVQKALKSSTDLDAAIAEALKVQEVEDLLGGLGSEVEKALRDYEDQAKERLRIATQYGFDVTAIEKRNAEDRAKLIDQILEQRVGSLKQLLEDMAYGDLFEGSLVDQRQALLGEIAKARTDADNGVDGAGDTLASLLRKLQDVSRDAYGTAGPEYAADRATAQAAAEAVIKAENDRIKAAQDAQLSTVAKLETSNALADEANDLLTQIAKNTAALASLTGSSAAATSSATSAWLSSVYRQAKL